MRADPTAPADQSAEQPATAVAHGDEDLLAVNNTGACASSQAQARAQALPQSLLQAQAAPELGCAHYRRKCRLVAPCCGGVYSCRFCHDEQQHDLEPDPQRKHKLNRHAVREVICNICDTRQPSAESCVSCGTRFARYFCAVCNLYDDEGLTKHIFHCDKCGLCRVGPREAYFHCDGCNVCLSVSLRDKHKCIGDSMQQNCPVCQEFLFDSRSAATVLRCGHTMHMECRRRMMDAQQFTCPVCSASLEDLSDVWLRYKRDVIDATPMPAEYRYDVKVLCNDCHRESHTPFHIDGLECKGCGSFNTRRI